MKRETVKVPLTATLVKGLDFKHWPVSPMQWNGHRLVTEPTPPHVKDWTIRDTVTRGLGVRVTPNAKSYFVQRKRKGSTSDRWVLTDQRSLQDARVQAANWYARMADGGNPTKDIKDIAQAEAAIKAAKSYTFALAFADYIKDGEARVAALTLRPASLKDRKVVVRWMADSDLWSTPLALVDTPIIKTTFEPLFAAAERARRAKRLKDEDEPKKRSGLASDLAAVHKVLTYCKACWNWSKGTKVAVNPFAAWAKNTKLPKVGRRQTVLATESKDGTAWLQGLVALRDDENPIIAMLADYVLIATLWGGRRTELAEIRWVDVNYGDIWACFAPETTKGDKAHYVPLTPWATEILKERHEKNRAQRWPVKRGDRVFPYPTTKTGKIEDYRPIIRKLKEQTGLWIRLHDLRRTLATSVFGFAGDLGTVSFALGHTSDKEVTADYVHRQAALAALRVLYHGREKHLRQLIGLDAAPASAAFTDFQKSMIQTIQNLLKQAGFDKLPPTDLAELLQAQ
ncbi:tyrosine-type recombinase/integrase [Dyella sp. S184]|uniref:tyrosine-type recombinase/integrase n=1 Tax=Dyella sp. S184 TaxID=1641862 RepID=UPI00131CB280|nr:tyrosine-type recombinase/integrase [Dyella sp. S184]